MRLPEIISILRTLNEEGYIQTQRKGPTGIGHLIETRFGLNETNVAVADIGGRVEIKATRRNATSLITLFTFNRGVWRVSQSELINKYGYIDEKNRTALYNSVTNIPNSQGFYIDLDENKNIIILKNDQTTIAEWSLFTVVGKFMTKLDRLLLIFADSMYENDIECFHFNEAWLLERPTPENFIESFRNNKIIIDIRMHLKENGGVRNHGTAFRIAENNLLSLFADQRRLIP